MGPKMPVSLVCESQTDISSAIRNSLSNGVHNGLISSTQSEKNIQNQFVASAKRALLSKIEYEEVSNINNSVHDTLKSKYIVLKPPTSTSAATVTSVNSNNNGKSMVNGCGMEKHNGSGKCLKCLQFIFLFTLAVFDFSHLSFVNKISLRSFHSRQ